MPDTPIPFGTYNPAAAQRERERREEIDRKINLFQRQDSATQAMLSAGYYSQTYDTGSAPPPLPANLADMFQGAALAHTRQQYKAGQRNARAHAAPTGQPRHRRRPCARSRADKHGQQCKAQAASGAREPSVQGPRNRYMEITARRRPGMARHGPAPV